MKRAILPAARLRLRAGAHVKTALLALLLVAIAAAAVAGIAWFVGSAATIGRDQDVWARGVPAASGHFEGERTSKVGLTWLLATYEGTASYTAADGARYEGDIYFWTMFGGPSTDVTDGTELRYDPDHPERFAIGWAVEASGARWRAVITMCLFLAFVALVCAYGAWAIVDNARHHARAASVGDELPLRIVAVHPVLEDGKRTGRSRYELAYLHDDQPRTLIRELPPVLAAPDDAHTLGLWLPGRPETIIVLERDLAPLAVDDATRTAILDRATRAPVTDTPAAAPSA